VRLSIQVDAGRQFFARQPGSLAAQKIDAGPTWMKTYNLGDYTRTGAATQARAAGQLPAWFSPRR
jgi:hypothetical protein